MGLGSEEVRVRRRAWAGLQRRRRARQQAARAAAAQRSCRARGAIVLLLSRCVQAYLYVRKGGFQVVQRRCAKGEMKLQAL